MSERTLMSDEDDGQTDEALLPLAIEDIFSITHWDKNRIRNFITVLGYEFVDDTIARYETQGKWANHSKLAHKELMNHYERVSAEMKRVRVKLKKQRRRERDGREKEDCGQAGRESSELSAL